MLCLEWTEKDPWAPARRAGDWADVAKTTKTPLTLQPKRNKISNLPVAVKAWVWALVAATAVVAVPAVAAAVVVVGDSGAATAEFPRNATHSRLPATVVAFFEVRCDHRLYCQGFFKI